MIDRHRNHTPRPAADRPALEMVREPARTTVDPASPVDWLLLALIGLPLVAVVVRVLG